MPCQTTWLTPWAIAASASSRRSEARSSLKWAAGKPYGQVKVSQLTTGLPPSAAAEAAIRAKGDGNSRTSVSGTSTAPKGGDQVRGRPVALDAGDRPEPVTDLGKGPVELVEDRVGDERAVVVA